MTTVGVLIPVAGNCPYRALNRSWVTDIWMGNGFNVVVGYAEPGLKWCKARAVSDGLTVIDADVIIVTDGDVWADDSLIGLKAVLDGAPYSAPHSEIHRLDPGATSQVLQGGELGGKLMRTPYPSVPGGGMLIIRRELWNQIPLDPRFVGWGQEDEAWSVALSTLAGPAHRTKGALWHLWHPPQERRNSRMGSRESNNLRNRYFQARGKPDQMRALINEGRGV